MPALLISLTTCGRDLPKTGTGYVELNMQTFAIGVFEKVTFDGDWREEWIFAIVRPLDKNRKMCKLSCKY